MEATQVAPQRFQPVSQRDTKILDAGRRVAAYLQDQQFAEGRPLHFRREPCDVLPPKSSSVRRMAKTVITSHNMSA